ncbi:MAG: hypothetical protein JRF33_19420 [Deltaproteobacteria bacterium]|nr:hypothetical protein [Deltaproteobacteria bacterium]
MKPLLAMLLLGTLFCRASYAAVDPLARVEELLADWQLVQAGSLLQKQPDSPATWWVEAWVEFHKGDHPKARQLADRAVEAMGPAPQTKQRLELIRAMDRITTGFVQYRSPDGRVVIQYAPGVDEVVLPYVEDAVRRTLKVVGRDLGHEVEHPVLVQLLPNAEALASATGLSAEEIATSGTIAVCKYNRLMIISPRATLRGFGYLDTASHELVHLIISEKTHNRTPIWIHEALAKYEESRWRSDEPDHRTGLHPLRATRLRRAVTEDRLVSFEQMHPSMALLPSAEAAELAFSEVYTVTEFLLARKGYEGIRALLEGLAQKRPGVELVGELDNLRTRKAMGGKSEGERRLSAMRRVDLRDHFHLGQLLRARGRTRASVVEYQKAQQKAGSKHVASFVIQDKLGLALLALGHDEGARQAFSASLLVQPDGLEAHLHLGQLQISENPAAAYLNLRQALRINPLDPRVHVAMMRLTERRLKDGDEGRNWQGLVERHARALLLIRNHAQSVTQGIKGMDSGPGSVSSGMNGTTWSK